MVGENINEIDNYKLMETIKKFYNKLPKFPDGRIDFSDSDTAQVITVIVKFDGRILMLKRSNAVSTYKCKWQAVAGYLDEIKPLKEKLLEELKEEANIKEENIREIKYGKKFESADKSIGKTWIVHPVLVELNKKPNIRLNFEHSEYKWVKAEQISKLDIAPNLEESIKRVLK